MPLLRIYVSPKNVLLPKMYLCGYPNLPNNPMATASAGKDSALHSPFIKRSRAERCPWARRPRGNPAPLVPRVPHGPLA